MLPTPCVVLCTELSASLIREGSLALRLWDELCIHSQPEDEGHREPSDSLLPAGRVELCLRIANDGSGRCLPCERLTVR